MKCCASSTIALFPFYACPSWVDGHLFSGSGSAVQKLIGPMGHVQLVLLVHFSTAEQVRVWSIATGQPSWKKVHNNRNALQELLHVAQSRTTQKLVLACTVHSHLYISEHGKNILRYVDKLLSTVLLGLARISLVCLVSMAQRNAVDSFWPACCPDMANILRKSSWDCI